MYKHKHLLTTTCIFIYAPLTPPRQNIEVPKSPKVRAPTALHEHELYKVKTWVWTDLHLATYYWWFMTIMYITQYVSYKAT